MNKILIKNNEIDTLNIDSSINVEYFSKDGIFDINDIKINIVSNTTLNLMLNLKEETKLNIVFSISKNTHLKLNIFTKGIGGKIQYKYNIENDSKIDLFKYNNLNSIKEMVIVNLIGENSSINYNFKTISKNKETYDYHVFHKAKNTISNIKNNGVTIKDGEIIYQVSSFVPQNISGCIVNQNNRIINLNDKKSEILPNLYIDCYDVSASHSALIGKFSENEMFYLKSRGLTHKMALNLLIRGFLTSDFINDFLLKNINKDIDKYWR